MSSLPEHLRKANAEARERYERARTESDRPRDEPPRPGEIFVFPETAELDVLWTVLEQDRDDPRHLWAVATDLHPLVGSTDVAVPPDSAPGALSLRCGCALRLETVAFAEVKRTGIIASEILAQARSKRAAIEAGGLQGDALEQETDALPEYQDWREELVRAREALAATREKKEMPDTEAEPEWVLTAEGRGEVSAPPSWRRWLENPYGLAASVLLTVAVGLGGGSALKERQIDELRQERERLRETYVQEIAQLRQRLENPELSSAAFNFPVQWLYPTRQQRSEPVAREEDTIQLLPTADRLVLLLWVEEPYPEYRLTLQQKDTDREIWSESGLIKNHAHEVIVELPSRWLDNGDYWLSLYGLVDGRAERVAEYALRLEKI